MIKKMIISNRVLLKGIDWQNKRRLMRELSCSNPEYENRLKLDLSVYNCPQRIRMYKDIDTDELEIEYGSLDLIDFKEVGMISVDLAKSTRQCIPGEFISDIPLYDYQEEAVSRFTSCCDYGILQSKAGSGKTRMGIAIACNRRVRTLWLTHTKDLLNQAYDAACEFIPREYLGKITDGKVQIGKFITFATVQTLSRMDMNEFKYQWEMVIVDECHRAAGSVQKVTMFGKVLRGLAARYKIGLSATPKRGDGLIDLVFSLLGHVRHIVPDSVVKVMPVTVMPVMTTYDFDFDNVSNEEGVLNFGMMINDIVEDKHRNILIANEIFKAVKDGKSVLVLSARVGHLKMLKAMCGLDQFQTRLVSGNTNKEIREKSIEDMRRGETAKVLFATYQLAKEGLDIPVLSTLILATPMKDETTVIQSVGRIARTCDGKPDPVCIDIVDGANHYLLGMFKKRKTAYRKCGCEIIGG